MEINPSRQLIASAVSIFTLVAAATAEEREWADRSGKFTVMAEFVGVDGDNVVLRRSNGKEFKVPIERISDADQEFVKAQSIGAGDTDAAAVNEIIAKIAADFYADLRTQERQLARQSLTKKAESLITAGQSPLVGLPQPAPGKNSVRPGEVSIDGDLAEIPVLVRAGGTLHKTKLHLRREEELWRVFALSAAYPDGEKSINFEAAVAAAAQDVDPLLALIGKPLEFEGYTVDGERIDIAQYKGKVVLLDFWATWCGPCRAEIPNIRQNWDKHHDAGFEVIAASVDDDLDSLETFVAEEKPPWTVVADNHPNNRKSMAARFGIRGIPAFILVGRDGKVVTVHCRGERLGQSLAKLINNRGERTSSRDISVVR
jgi:thiol-disulfide isomerase/thioredoxin